MGANRAGAEEWSVLGRDGEGARIWSPLLGEGKLLGSASKGSGKQKMDAAVCQRAQNWLFSKELPLFQQKKPEVPPPSTNPFLEDETGAETDEIVIEKSDTDKVSL